MTIKQLSVATAACIHLMINVTDPAFARDSESQNGRNLIGQAEAVVDKAPDAALKLTDEFLEYGEFSDPVLLARAHFIRSCAFAHKNDYAKSVYSGQQALDLTRPADKTLRADILDSVALSAARLNDTKQAFDLLQQALSIREEIGDTGGLATSNAVIAELYYDVGLHEQSATRYNIALEQARESGDTYSLIRILNNYAFASLFSDQADKSLGLLKEAQGLAKFIDNPRILAYVNQNTGHALVHLGQHDEAEAYVEAAYRFAQDGGAPELLTGIHLARTKIAISQGDFAAARQEADTALRFAESINYVERISDLNQLVAEIEAARGNYESAYGYLGAHVLHLEKLAQASLMRSASLFEGQEELQQKKQELIRAQQAEEISRLELAKAEAVQNGAIFVIGLLLILLLGGVLFVREKLRAKRSLVLKNRELSAAKAAADIANKAKSNFMGVMSHELRTPLNAVIGFSDIIEEEKLGPVGQSDYKVFAHHINQQGNRLLHMVDDILLITDADSGKLSAKSGIEPVEDLCRAALQLSPTYQQDGKDRTVRLDVSATELAIDCDPALLTRALAHLIDNALKFTEGNVHLRAMLDNSGAVVLEVSDDGPGFDQADVQNFLSPFSQADESRSRTHEGAGLGLHVVHLVLALHGCDLSIRTDRTDGTTARIIFPCNRTARLTPDNGMQSDDCPRATA